MSDQIKQIVTELNGRIAEYVETIYPNAVRKGEHFALANQYGDPPKKNGSFRITLSGEKLGLCHDFSTGKSMDLLDATMHALGVDKYNAIKFAKEFLGLNGNGKFSVFTRKHPQPSLLEPLEKKSAPPTFEYGSKSYRDRNHKRLIKNDSAMEYLRFERGYNPQVFKHFELGLGYSTSKGQSDALLCPVMNMKNGRFLNKTYMYNIPGVTIKPADINGWGKFPPMTYPEGKYNNQEYVFVCEGLKDLWANWDNTRDTKTAKHVFFISSTHGTSIPAEWKNINFWIRFKKVYCGQDNDDAGDDLAFKLTQIAGRECRRVRTPLPRERGKDWNDFWRQGHTYEEFISLIKDAPVVTRPIEIQTDAKTGEMYGDLEYTPIDINGAFHNGHLYYTTTIMNREKRLIEDAHSKGEYKVFEQKKIVVIRSDRTKHTAFYTEAQEGTKLEDRICRLSDNTIIKSPPKPSDYSSWSYKSIKHYLQGKSNLRALPSLCTDVYKHIYSTVWLPYKDDYTLLALLVFVSYAQQIFDAVPYVFLNGSAGTGKSRTGAAMADISYNATVIGGVSGPTLARVVDQSRGLVVIDDLEAIGKKSAKGQNPAFSDIEQILKVGYQKRTAIRILTDIKSGRVVEYNFYGVKIINNTSGVDNILGTRMLRIQTRKMPEKVKEDFISREKISPKRLKELRDELHTWIFENTQKVEKTYRCIHPGEKDRQQEIAASLRTIAALIESEEISESLERSLSRIAKGEDFVPSQEKLVHVALQRIVVQGYTYVSINQIRLEVLKMIDPYYGRDYTNEIPDILKTDWIGREIRNAGYIDDDATDKRIRMQDGTTSRAPLINDSFIEEAYIWAEKEKMRDATISIDYSKKKPGDFCKGCHTCEYREIGCDVYEKLEKALLAKEKPVLKRIF